MLTAAAHAHHASSGLSVAAVALVVIGALALWLGSLYQWPFAPCPRCQGSGLNRGSSKKRFGECKRCRGRRRVQRRGSRTVHRLARSIRGEIGRTRQGHRDELAARRAEHPRRLNDD